MIDNSKHEIFSCENPTCQLWISNHPVGAKLKELYFCAHWKYDNDENFEVGVELCSFMNFFFKLGQADNVELTLDSVANVAKWIFILRLSHLMEIFFGLNNAKTEHAKWQAS